MFKIYFEINIKRSDRIKLSHCFIKGANINNTEKTLNNTESATQKKLRQIMHFTMDVFGISLQQIYQQYPQSS